MGACMGMYGKRGGEDLAGNGGKSAGRKGREMAKKMGGVEGVGGINE